jgi:hypothetical protein
MVIEHLLHSGISDEDAAAVVLVGRTGDHGAGQLDHPPAGASAGRARNEVSTAPCRKDPCQQAL